MMKVVPSLHKSHNPRGRVLWWSHNDFITRLSDAMFICCTWFGLHLSCNHTPNQLANTANAMYQTQVTQH